MANNDDESSEASDDESLRTLVKASTKANKVLVDNLEVLTNTLATGLANFATSLGSLTLQLFRFAGGSYSLAKLNQDAPICWCRILWMLAKQVGELAEAVNNVFATLDNGFIDAST